MTKYKQRDIILVDFGFSETRGSKRRPALIISSDEYHKGRQEIIIAAITSNMGRVLIGDIKIDGWKEAGLLYPSVVTGIIRTIRENLIVHKLGAILQPDHRKVQKNLKKVLGL